ncbi:AAA family ATPase [Sulfurimonas sp.]|uniref:AAA family ATPase n=1 Tax=Sulfurimonas sp. TaxID=2022749 RepID=UPI0035692CAF
MKILNEFIKKNHDLVDQMKACSYSYDKNNLNLHHLEGDVWTHTMMAYTNTVKYKCSNIVKWAVILHDIGRIYTRNENKKHKRISFGNFEGVSVFTSIDVLNKTDLTHDEKIKIFKIISYQYTIIDHIKYNKPSIKKLLSKFQYEENILEELAQYARCDLLGRKISQSKINMYNKKNMQDFITYTKNIKQNKKILMTKKYSITILVGPPCSKKSTWVEANRGDSIIINRDSCVEEIGRKYNKNNYDEAYYYMRDNKNIKDEVDALDDKKGIEAKNSKNKNIIIDNPNLSIKNRRKWIDAFKVTHVIKLIVFLPSFEQLQKCSKERGKKINKNISRQNFINKFKLFNFPLLNEGIDYITYKK